MKALKPNQAGFITEIVVMVLVVIAVLVFVFMRVNGAH
jgi:Tfp pilus assembly protein PilX